MGVGNQLKAFGKRVLYGEPKQQTFSDLVTADERKLQEEKLKQVYLDERMKQRERIARAKAKIEADQQIMSYRKSPNIASANHNNANKAFGFLMYGNTPAAPVKKEKLKQAIKKDPSFNDFLMNS